MNKRIIKVCLFFTAAFTSILHIHLSVFPEGNPYFFIMFLIAAFPPLAGSIAGYCLLQTSGFLIQSFVTTLLYYNLLKWKDRKAWKISALLCIPLLILCIYFPPYTMEDLDSIGMIHNISLMYSHIYGSPAFVYYLSFFLTLQIMYVLIYYLLSSYFRRNKKATDKQES